MTPEELCLTLKKLFEPNTQVVAEATTFLKTYFKEVEALENLLILLATHEDQQVRQVSCVYARKVVGKLWMKLTADQREKTKQLLIERFVAEPVTLVKRNIADVIGMLGKILIPNGEWMELFQFIFKSTQSDVLAEKELAMMLLSVIIEYFSLDLIEKYYEQLNPIIEDYLRSDQASLKTLSIETVNKLATIEHAPKILKKYNNLIPLVVSALDENQEELAAKVFETFNEFVEFKKVLGPSLPAIIEKALSIAENQDFGLNLRAETMYFIGAVASTYSKQLIKAHGIDFVKTLVEKGFKIASEDPEMYAGLDETPMYYAQAMLSDWAVFVPSDKIYPIFQTYLQQFGTSQNEFERAAATSVLASICTNDGLLDNIRQDCNAYANFLCDRLTDSSFRVREAAGECCGQFSETVGDDFLNNHKKIMPVLIKVARDLLASKSEDAIKMTLLALNEFIKALDYDVKYYINETISLLNEFFNSPDFPRPVYEIALQAMGTTITVAEKKIIPYKEQLATTFHNAISSTSQSAAKLQQVKGQALMCAGRLISACGRKEVPEALIEEFTKFAIQCLDQKTDQQTELRETAFNFFGDLVIVIKEEIGVVFNVIVDNILETLKSESDHKKITKGNEGGKGFSLDSDSEGEVLGVELNLNVLDEKSAAISCLGYLGWHAPKLFATRFQEIVEMLQNMESYVHENVRFHVSMTYTQITQGLCGLNGVMNADGKFEWTKGHPDQSPLPAQVQEYLDRVAFPFYFKTFNEDDDKEVIERALTDMGELAESFGPGAFKNQMPATIEIINKFLDKKTYCQGGAENPEDMEEVAGADNSGEDYGDEDEDDDDLDHDEIILGNVVDFINSLAKAFGDTFLEGFNQIAPHLVVYTSEKHPKSDRNAALGCFATVFHDAPAVISPYFNDFWTLVKSMCGTKDSKINRNLAYAIGVLAQNGGATFLPIIESGEAMQLLQALYNNSENQDAKDNVVASRLRIAEFQLMPMAVKPPLYTEIIESTYQSVPFEGDDTENLTVLKFTYKLWMAKDDVANPLVVKYMDNIAKMAVKVIADPKTADFVNDKDKYEVGAFIKEVVVAHAQATLQQLEAQMSPDEKELLTKYIQ